MTKSMKIYQRVYNASVGQFQMTETLVTVTFKPTVATQADLPLIGNALYDGIIELENNQLFIWNGTEWLDQGVYDAYDQVEGESIPGFSGSGASDWSQLTSKPSSSVANIDDAVSKRHVQGTDQGLDTGGINAVTVAQVKNAVINNHSHSNKSILDNIQEALTTVLKNAYDSAVSFMNSFALVGQSIGDVIRWNGSNWVPGTATNNAGAGVALYFDDNLSGVSTYKSLTSAPLSSIQINDTVVVNNNSVYFPNAYASSALGGSQIDAGEWLFDIYRWVSTNSGVTYITFEVYKRDISGTETLLFTTTTGEINDTANTFGEIETVQPAFPINPTDVLVIKPIATTNRLGNVTINYSYDGVNNYSHMHTPLIVRHNQLAGLQGGQANEYNHLTNSQLVDVQFIPTIALQLMLTAFRVAQIGSLTIFNMVKGFMDEYEDESGIDTANSLNQVYDSIDDYYHPEFDDYTKLLLHFDNNLNDSETIAKTVTNHNGVIFSSSQFKFGGYSAEFNTGAYNQYLSVPASTDFNFGSDDFTIDTWIKFNYINAVQLICSQWGAGGYNIGWAVTPTVMALDYHDGIAKSKSEAWSPSTGVWYHIAIVRNGNDLDFYVDGNKLGSTTDVTGSVFNSTTTPFVIGASNDPLYFLQGYLDEFRVSKGFARWTGNFTPPAIPYIISANMTLLSLPQTAADVPTAIRINIFEEDIDSVVLNTDLKAYISRDNGATFTEAVLEDEGNYIATARILSAVVDVSLQPSGTQVVYKLVTDNLKKLNIHGVGIAWK